MIPVVLAAVGALGTLPAPSVQVEHQEVRSIGIEVVMQFSETHFEARNVGMQDYLLVFGDARQGVLAHRLIHAGTSISFEFQKGLLDGIFVELLTPDHHDWAASGAFPLGELARSRSESVWIQRSGRSLNAWIERSTGFDLWSDFGPLAPQSPAERQQAEIRESRKSMHVPVVDPSDEPEEEKPPVLEPKPRPPV